MLKIRRHFWNSVIKSLIPTILIFPTSFRERHHQVLRNENVEGLNKKWGVVPYLSVLFFELESC